MMERNNQAMTWILLSGLLASLTQAQSTGEGKFGVSGDPSDLWELKEVPGCRTQPLPEHLKEWTMEPSYTIDVKWTYGENVTDVCTSENSCFHQNLVKDVPLPVQLQPIILQSGALLKFHAGRGLVQNFTMKPYKVNKEAFEKCDLTGGIPITERFTQESIIVEKKFLTVGHNYFIAASESPFMQCQLGLRLNVTVKEHNCKGAGEPGLCWNRGRCVTSYHKPVYECICCNGYTAMTCGDLDACASDPCMNHGTCVDIPSDPSGEKFQCVCPIGWTGMTCEKQLESQCLSEPCEHNGTCTGDKNTFTCNCPPGWTGSHCEVDVNECESSPCINGMCVDKENRYECFCIPGHGGHNCEIEFNECESAPCRNDGFCVNKVDSYECHCGMGYTGIDCSMKVDLCSPSPCENATECVDFGNYFSCTCNPGFQGSHCEININECASNPCLNYGQCYDQIAGYRCVCRAGTAGTHCEHVTHPQMPKPMNTNNPVIYPRLHHRSHLHNLLIVAGTLAGALLIALTVLAGCYCRFYGTRTVLTCRQFKYKKQKDLSEPQEQNIHDTSSTSHPRPSVDAIIEASTSKQAYRENPMNTPLMTSLKPRKI